MRDDELAAGTNGQREGGGRERAAKRNSWAPREMWAETRNYHNRRWTAKGRAVIITIILININIIII